MCLLGQHQILVFVDPLAGWVSIDAVTLLPPCTWLPPFGPISLFDVCAQKKLNLSALAEMEILPNKRSRYNVEDACAGERVTRLPGPVRVTKCGTVRALFVRSHSTFAVGWASLDRSARGKERLVERVVLCSSGVAPGTCTAAGGAARNNEGGDSSKNHHHEDHVHCYGVLVEDDDGVEQEVDKSESRLLAEQFGLFGRGVVVKNIREELEIGPLVTRADAADRDQDRDESEQVETHENGTTSTCTSNCNAKARECSSEVWACCGVLKKKSCSGEEPPTVQFSLPSDEVEKCESVSTSASTAAPASASSINPAFSTLLVSTTPTSSSSVHQLGINTTPKAKEKSLDDAVLHHETQEHGHPQAEGPRCSASSSSRSPGITAAKSIIFDSPIRAFSWDGPNAARRRRGKDYPNGACQAEVEGRGSSTCGRKYDRRALPHYLRSSRERNELQLLRQAAEDLSRLTSSDAEQMNLRAPSLVVAAEAADETEQLQREGAEAAKFQQLPRLVGGPASKLELEDEDTTVCETACGTPSEEEAGTDEGIVEENSDEEETEEHGGFFGVGGDQHRHTECVAFKPVCRVQPLLFFNKNFFVLLAGGVRASVTSLLFRLLLRLSAK